MFRIRLTFSSVALRPLPLRLAAFAAAALAVFAGCVTSKPGQDMGDGASEQDMDLLPQAVETSTVRDAAVAARADKAATTVVPTTPAAEASTIPATEAPAVPDTPAAVPAPAVSAAVPPPSREDLAALASKGSTSNDSEIFTDDESKSRGNKFEPIIGQGYRLQIVVRVGDRDEVGPIEVMVSEKGDISLPIVGRVQCKGLTINALHSRLSGIYADYFTDPDVDVMFAYSEDGISPYGQVLVQGRVAREGWVNIPPTRNLRLSHAIQRSGGFASSALRRKVLVLRRSDDGNLDRHVIDFKAIGKNGELDNDILLEPNDVIYVDESNF